MRRRGCNETPWGARWRSCPPDPPPRQDASNPCTVSARTARMSTDSSVKKCAISNADKSTANQRQPRKGTCHAGAVYSRRRSARDHASRRVTTVCCGARPNTEIFTVDARGGRPVCPPVWTAVVNMGRLLSRAVHFFLPFPSFPFCSACLGGYPPL